MSNRSVSIDSTYNLRKNPLNIRASDGSDLIFSKEDRLVEMPLTSSDSYNSNYSTHPNPFSTNHSSHLNPTNLSCDLPLPNKEFQTYSSQASKSSSSLHSTHSSVSDLNSPATIYTSQSRNSSNIGFGQEKELRNSVDLSTKASTPLKSSFTFNDADKPAKQVFHDVISDDETSEVGDDTVDQEYQSDENYQAPAFAPLSSLQPPNLSTSMETSSTAFLPLELSLATDDFSSLVEHDFSKTSFSYSYGAPRSVSPEYLPSTSNSSSSGLGRKNTISSTNGKIRTSNSTVSSSVFERMRSFRKTDPKTESQPQFKTQLQFPGLSNPSSSKVSTSSVSSKPEGSIDSTESSVHLEREASRSSNFSILSCSTTSDQPGFLPRTPPTVKQSNSLTRRNQQQQQPVRQNIVNQPFLPNTGNRTVSTSSVMSNTSTASFDSHIAEQLNSIPTALLNAISFTPPTSATEPENEIYENIEPLDMSDGADGDKLAIRSGLDPISDSIPEENEDSEDSQLASTNSTTTVETPVEENPIDVDDRGRFFVRIEGLQGLQLPLVQFRKPKFTMTLDNGVQSVTIDPLPITATNPGVGQEFELVVGQDLQFILTFHASQDPIPSSKKKDEEALKEEKAKEELRLAKAKEEKAKQDKIDTEQRIKERELQNATISTRSHTPQGSPKKPSRFRGLFTSPKKKHSAAENAANMQGLSENNAKKTSTTIAIETTVDLRTNINASKNTNPETNTKTVAKPKIPEFIPKDIWEGLVGPRGEFGRCYLVESQYEKEVFGHPRTFNLVLYNEWSYTEVPIEQDNASAENPAESEQGPSLSQMLLVTNQTPAGSSRPKDSGSQLNTNEAIALATRYRTKYKNEKPLSSAFKYKKVPVAPYKIATVQVTMMYIPRATMAGKLPISMKSAVKELALAKVHKNISLDGFLSQEGGDCNYWRRRWFTLRAAEFVGHTEDTKKVRTVLNIANVKTVLDTEHMTHQEKREMMASCMYHDRAFRMTFKDGEVITFYADSIDSKNAWMDALNISIAHCTGKSFEWSDVVMAYHDYEKEKLKEAHEQKVQREKDRIKEQEEMSCSTRLVTAEQLMKM